MGERLPQHVNRFLEAHIDSVEQLEALVLISEDPGRAWTAAEVSKRCGDRHYGPSCGSQGAFEADEQL